MRILQNSSVYPSYFSRLRALEHDADSFAAKLNAFLDDRFAATHILEPAYRRDSRFFLTNGNDPTLQRAWAREHGLSRRSSLDEILRSQLEEHRTEVLYNLDPFRYDARFVRTLPGCVKRSIAWVGTPTFFGADFRNYDLVVGNFRGILARVAEQQGVKTSFFCPSYDPEMEFVWGKRRSAHRCCLRRRVLKISYDAR